MQYSTAYSSYPAQICRQMFFYFCSSLFHLKKKMMWKPLNISYFSCVTGFSFLPLSCVFIHYLCRQTFTERSLHISSLHKEQLQWRLSAKPNTLNPVWSIHSFRDTAYVLPYILGTLDLAVCLWRFFFLTFFTLYYMSVKHQVEKWFFLMHSCVNSPYCYFLGWATALFFA